MPRDLRLTTPQTPLGPIVIDALNSNAWTSLHAAVAYVKMSGVKHLEAPLKNFAINGGVATFTVGIDQQVSTLEGVQALWACLGTVPGSVRIYHNPASSGPTFHPKVWLFEKPGEALLISGSGNLTQGGMYTNHEFGSCLSLDLSDTDDNAIFEQAHTVLNEWSDPTSPCVVLIDADALRTMYDCGELPSEAEAKTARRFQNAARAKAVGNAGSNPAVSALFTPLTPQKAPEVTPSANLGKSPVTPPPRTRVVKPQASATSTSGSGATTSSPPGTAAPSVASISSAVPLHTDLYMEVSTADKTEIYLGKRIRLQDPMFFGFPFLGLTNPKKPGRIPQPQPDPLPSAEIKVYEANGTVTPRLDPSMKLWIYTNGPSANEDFRMTIPQDLLKRVPTGSIMRMSLKAPAGTDYLIEFYAPGTTEHTNAQSKLNDALRGGRKFGWA